MKLKDSNDVLEKVISESLKELSNAINKENESKDSNGKVSFDHWTNPRFLDKDKNICVRGALEFHILDVNDRVVSFKMLLDRALILRKNEGTIEQPKYGKQLGYEDLRRKILSEVIGKGVSGLALGLAEKTKEQIEDFNKQVPENLENHDI